MYISLFTLASDSRFDWFMILNNNDVNDWNWLKRVVWFFFYINKPVIVSWIATDELI